MFWSFTFIKNNPSFKEFGQVENDTEKNNWENIVEDSPVDSSGLCKISVRVWMTHSTVSEIKPSNVFLSAKLYKTRQISVNQMLL